MQDIFYFKLLINTCMKIKKVLSSAINTYLYYYLHLFFHLRRKPRVLQLPITSKCNSRCLTCNIWKHKERIDIDYLKLQDLFKNSFFSDVVAVGINGGEPSLHANFVDVVNAVLTLPQIESIFIISNCINKDKLLSLLREIYPICKDHGVILHLQISVDGIGEVHNNVRGIKISFDRVIQTINELCEHKEMYLDEFDIGCTISKYNVDYLVQVEEYFSEYDVPVYFHLAVPNKRIHNFEDAPFTVMSDTHSRQMAKEFFHKKYNNSKMRMERIRYFLIYYYLTGNSQNDYFSVIIYIRILQSMKNSKLSYVLQLVKKLAIYRTRYHHTKNTINK